LIVWLHGATVLACFIFSPGGTLEMQSTFDCIPESQPQKILVVKFTMQELDDFCSLRGPFTPPVDFLDFIKEHVTGLIKVPNGWKS
jgi:hypothetical protein